jgi:TetR/AcrR family fatty acid metabolism transcriptional regulator
MLSYGLLGGDQSMGNGERKEVILLAAERLVSRKGLHDTTISEIAADAGVADSVIYHYFKNKEDLAFSIIGNHIRRFHARLQEHLEGILEPKSRLSKAIWFHLRYNETHRDCARMLLFECRSNRSFYEHESYELLREYAELLLSILTKGIEDGDFRDDVDMCVMRDLILGALDWETLRSLSKPEGKHKFSDVQEIMDLVYAMIGTRGVERKEPDKSKRIITAAEKLFSEKGYRQTSVAEIARQADVAEGTVYEYFKNKEDLLFSIPKLRFREHVDSLTELFQIRAPMRKLRRFIRYHYVLYLTQPDFLKTFLLDLQLNPRFYETEALAFFREYSAIVDDILDEGKSDESFRASVNNRIFQDLLFGGFFRMALQWLIVNTNENSDKLAAAHEALTLLVRAVKRD